ncbi:MAG: hypothetical protein P8188_03230 [Gemmatimonadota bacterium]
MRSRFLPDALGILAEAGYEGADVEVATIRMDDVPTELVVRQFPVPAAGAAALRQPPVALPIMLVVAVPVPRIPDLQGWRGDRALFVLEALGMPGRVIGPDVDLAGVEVTAQRPEPGAPPPEGPVALRMEPMPRRMEPTVRRSVDTVFVEVEREGPPLRPGDVQGPPEPLVVPRGVPTPLAVVATVAGLGLGLAGGTLLFRMRRGPTTPSKRDPWEGGRGRTSPPSDETGDGGLTEESEGGDDPRTPEDSSGEEEAAPPRHPAIPPFTAVVVDEHVWVEGSDR